MRTISILLALGGPAAAFAAPYELDFHVTGVASGSAEWNLHQSLLDELNDDVVDLDLTQQVGNAATAWAQNGISQLRFTDDQAILSGFPALAYRWNVNGVWECDMGVDTDVNYMFTNVKSGSSAYGGASRTLGTTLMHELGHCVRLGHKATEYNIMGDDWDHVHANGNTLYFYLGEDAADRLVDLHDVVTSFEDIGIVHWRYAGNADGDAYSDHERTVVMSSAYSELPSYTEDSGDTPVYLVRRGHTVRPEFTYENNGSTNTVTLDVEFVLSTNDTITSSDPALGTIRTSFGRDNVFTTSHLVTIPSNTAPGRYTIGARAIDLVGLTDDRPANNATYIDIDVLANGDDDYCLGDVPCERFEGDCDSDADCAAGLQCISNNGPQFGFGAATDVCDLPLGDPNYCTTADPCSRGQGDCDSSAQCEAGLYCAANVGAQYGWAADVDVCELGISGLSGG